MIYPIVLYGDPVLKKRALAMEKGAVDLDQLIGDMFETMYNANGVGLAAPQIGLTLRLFVIDTAAMEDDEANGIKKVFINAEKIEETGKSWAFEEGCLSIPGIREDVTRQPKIKLRYLDEEWNEQVAVFDGMVARVIQHEYDHIEGVLFTDHLSAFKKKLLRTKLSNISKGKVDADYRVKAPQKK
jgi:peptide deformylase